MAVRQMQGSMRAGVLYIPTPDPVPYQARAAGERNLAVPGRRSAVVVFRYDAHAGIEEVQIRIAEWVDAASVATLRAAAQAQRRTTAMQAAGTTKLPPVNQLTM